MAILRQNADDNKDDQKDDKKAAAEAKGGKKDSAKDQPTQTASRVLATAQARTAAGDDEYDFSVPHTGDEPKHLGGTVAKVTKDGDIVMSDHLTEGEMLRSAHEEGKRYEGRSADL